MLENNKKMNQYTLRHPQKWSKLLCNTFTYARNDTNKLNGHETVKEMPIMENADFIIS